MAAGLTGVLSMTGAAAQTASEAPDLVQETYRDWVVRCETPQLDDGTSGEQVCEMAQELSQTDSGQLVLRVALQAMADGTAALTLITPFGLRLSEGVAIGVAAQRVAEIGFRTCLPKGCIATGVLDATAIAPLKAGETAQVIMAADAGNNLSLSVTLNGFTGAWARLGVLRGE